MPYKVENSLTDSRIDTVDSIDKTPTINNRKISNDFDSTHSNNSCSNIMSSKSPNKNFFNCFGAVHEITLDSIDKLSKNSSVVKNTIGKLQEYNDTKSS